MRRTDLKVTADAVRHLGEPAKSGPNSTITSGSRAAWGHETAISLRLEPRVTRVRGQGSKSEVALLHARLRAKI